MNLLAKCSEGKNPSYLSVDLLPNESIKQTLTNLGNIYSIRSMWKLENFLTGLFPKKIGISLLRQSGVTVSMDTQTYQLTASELENLAKLCHNWRFPILSRGTWQEAQVTAGGIPITEIDATLQSQYIPRLFFCWRNTRSSRRMRWL